MQPIVDMGAVTTPCSAGGHSIGVPLAVAPKRLAHRAERVRPSTHPHERNAHRRAADLSLFRPPAGAHRAFVTKNSGISEKKLLALMLAAEDMAADVGSILYGEAVADGLIDPRAAPRRRL